MVGTIIAAADNDYLYIVCFEDTKQFENKFKALAKELSCRFVHEENKILNTLKEELLSYFNGNLKKFSVPLKTLGSDFQKNVWMKLQEIPFGSTYTYSDITKALGRPTTHARAVGSACGANTHLIVTPCHRLISLSSKGGFNSGINRKEWLIEHEKKYANNL
ncbi:methylated-DNA--protein-cysteine methyltransferase [Bombyx mori]|uniref:methylated-DNA--protein-cysteine methyltransferase n=1 Tax=Bombyx mori TaxID=7091 RepID=UPI002ED61E07